MFPARAGMSRVCEVSVVLWRYVPRASGDEPDTAEAIRNADLCSPRERG